MILLEARPWAGGVFDYRTRDYSSGVPFYRRSRELAEKIKAHSGIRFFSSTFMVGFYSNNLITAFQTGGETDSFAERYIEIKARSVVVATGCMERPLIFDHNDRPGVMQVGCAHRLAHTYGVMPGKQAVFSVGDNAGLEAAIDLLDLGMGIRAVADNRFDGQDEELLEALISRNIPFFRPFFS